MRFTPNFDLPCPEGTDYAAYALYMECLATQLDMELGAQMDALEGFVNRPASVWTRSTTQTNFFANETNFMSIFELETQVHWPYLFTTTPNIPPLRGWWHVGLTANLISSGAVTADTLRQIALRGDAVTNENGAVTTDYINFIDQVWESNTGNGENLTVQGTVYQPGFDTIILTGYVTVGNNASSLNMTTTPQPRLWVTYLGDTPEIQQVS